MERELSQSLVRQEKSTANWYPTVGLDSESLDRLFRLNGWPPTDLDYGMEFNLNSIAVAIPAELRTHRHLAEAKASILDADQAADLLGTSRRVIEGIAKRSLLGRKVGREWRFNLNSLLEWLAGSRSSAPRYSKPHRPKDEIDLPIPATADWSDRKANLQQSLAKAGPMGYTDDLGKVPERSSRKGGRR